MMTRMVFDFTIHHSARNCQYVAGWIVGHYVPVRDAGAQALELFAV
jgi:hypothetical protein